MNAYTEFQNLGDLLKYLIQKKGWSQGKLAIAMDSSPGYISRLIRNEIKEPRRSTLNKIYDIFKTDLADFALNSEDLIKINDHGNRELFKVIDDNIPEDFLADVKIAKSSQNLIRNISLDDLSAYVGRSPLVLITGIKGIGKSNLAQSFYQTNYRNFQKSIFLPLNSYSSISDIAESIGAYLGYENSGNPMRDIIAIARQHRCLIVLDNLDLDHQEYLTSYNLLLQQLMIEPHPSFIMVTCRSLPKGYQFWEPRLKALRLEGLAVSEASKLLENQGISPKIEQSLIKELIQKYGGNPLGLSLAAQDINEKFKGDLAAYLKHSTLFAGDLFDDIHSVLRRLSQLELEVLYWLALRKEPIYFMDILNDFPDQYKTSTIAVNIDAAINELCRRSLLASCNSEFYLQTEVQHCVEYCLLDDLIWELNTVLTLTGIDELFIPLRWLRCLDLQHQKSKLRERLRLHHANLLEQAYTKLDTLSSRVTDQHVGYAFTNLQYFLGLSISA